MRLLYCLLVAVPQLAAAICECGYSAPGTQDDRGPWLFTDMLESDFTRVQDVSELNDWVPQQFDVSAKDGRGRYGKAFSPGNIASRPKAKSGEGPVDAAGVTLRVGGAVPDGAVSVAEMDSANLDMHYGSYRAGMKLTAVNGTCAAFFWVRTVRLPVKGETLKPVASSTSTTRKRLTWSSCRKTTTTRSSCIRSTS